MPRKSKTDSKPESQHPQPTTVLFIRHGENEWTESHKLAGRTPGVHLNTYGRRQAEALGKRLAKTKLNAIYASPLERTMETAQAIVQHHPLEINAHQGLLEVDYGDWTGQKIKTLAKTPTWPMIQFYPSGAGFPRGESMYGMQTRFVQEINRIVAGHPGETIAEVCDRAENLLRGGFPVVVDGAFKRQSEREPVIEAARRTDARLVFLQTVCGPEEQHERLARRQQHDTRSDGRVELMEQQRGDFEEANPDHPELFHVVATDGPKPQTQTRVEELLLAEGLLPAGETPAPTE